LPAAAPTRRFLQATSRTASAPVCQISWLCLGLVDSPCVTMARSLARLPRGRHRHTRSPDFSLRQGAGLSSCGSSKRNRCGSEAESVESFFPGLRKPTSQAQWPMCQLRAPGLGGGGQGGALNKLTLPRTGIELSPQPGWFADQPPAACTSQRSDSCSANAPAVSRDVSQGQKESLRLAFGP